MSGLAPSRCFRSICGSTRIVIFAGSGMRPGRSSTVTPNGGPICAGSTLSRSSLSSCSSLAKRRPRPRKSAVSWPPMATTGTIGTPCSIASLTKPVRPAKSISRRLPARAVGLVVAARIDEQRGVALQRAAPCSPATPAPSRSATATRARPAAGTRGRARAGGSAAAARSGRRTPARTRTCRRSACRRSGCPRAARGPRPGCCPARGPRRGGRRPRTGAASGASCGCTRDPRRRASRRARARCRHMGLSAPATSPPAAAIMRAQPAPALEHLLDLPFSAIRPAIPGSDAG